MTRTRHARLRAAFLAALVLPLAACAAEPAAPTASPTQPAHVMATPTEEPVDPLEAVVAIEVRPDGLELRDAGGAVVAEVDYMGDAAEAVATLTAVFAAEPVSEPVEGDLHFPGGVKHSWEGFELMETHYDEERRAADDLDNLLWPRLIALVRAPRVGGVDVTSTAGRVGDRVDQLDVAIDQELWTCSGWAVEITGVTRASGATNTVGVSLSFSGATGMREALPATDETVTLVRAPADVAEGCV
ncbi:MULTISPECIES: hypothetical protein [unclassified Agromyces]|uniref:hypothetical protein n=1 Tax=unclassified Agromyces TaxID=2639701 RepID=UPI0030147033